MTRLCIVAEGLTELTFIEELLRPLLTDKSVVLMPSRSLGGNVRYERVKKLATPEDINDDLASAPSKRISIRLASPPGFTIKSFSMKPPNP